MSKSFLAILASLGLAGCATVPQPLDGAFTEVSLQDAANASGTRVRWGGEIVETVPEKDHTCIFILARPLDRQARPQRSKDSAGRFAACRPGFYDPEVFARGREVTVTGALHGSITRNVGDYEYVYPRVHADAVYLWPVAAPVRYDSWNYYDPFWGPMYRDPFWYRPVPVIVVPQQPAPPKSGK